MARGKKERKRRRKWSKKKGRRRAAIRMTLAGSFTLTVRRSRTVGQTDRQQDTVRGQSGERRGGEREQAIPIPRQTVNAFRLPFHVASFHVHPRCVCPDDLTHPRWLWRCSAANLTATKGWPKETSLLLPHCCCCSCCCCSCRCCKPAKTTLATWAWVGGAASANESVSAFLACCLLSSAFALNQTWSHLVCYCFLFYCCFSFSFCSRNAACKGLEIIGIKLEICHVCNIIFSYVFRIVKI